METVIMNTANASLCVKLDLIDKQLRDEWRIKRGCDYCYMVKYNQVHVLTNTVYSEILSEVFSAYEVENVVIHLTS
jgi:hypothetical protein